MEEESAGKRGENFITTQVIIIKIRGKVK